MTATDLSNDSMTTTDTTGTSGSVAERARARASGAYSTARERTSALYSTARDRASSVSTRSRSTVESNPAAAVAAGLAAGALVAALIPRSEREARALGPLGSKLTDKAREGVQSAKDAGRGKLDEIGLATLKDKIGEVVSGKKSGGDAQA